MANTPNYNLKKVEYTEIADIPGHFNSNFDTIDTEMKNNADAAIAAEDNAKSYAGGLVGTLGNLLTAAKDSIVAAINEVFGKVDTVENELAAHKADYATYKNRVISQNLSVLRDATLDGVQTVAYPDFGLPKKIKATSWLHGNAAFSIGTYDNGVQRGMVYYSTLAHNYYVDDIVYIGTDGSNRMTAKVSNITNTGFDLTWVKTGTLTGSVSVLVELFY